MRARSSIVLVAGLAAAAFACGAPANSDRDAARCAEMKSSLEGCLGGAAPELDCATLTPSDVSRIQGAMDTFSCTGLVAEDQFLDMLRRAAFYSGRTIQILKVAGAGPDHPFMAHVQESRYLKAVFCRVLD